MVSVFKYLKCLSYTTLYKKRSEKLNDSITQIIQTIQFSKYLVVTSYMPVNIEV